MFLQPTCKNLPTFKTRPVKLMLRQPGASFLNNQQVVSLPADPALANADQHLDSGRVGLKGLVGVLGAPLSSGHLTLSACRQLPLLAGTVVLLCGLLVSHEGLQFWPETMVETQKLHALAVVSNSANTLLWTDLLSIPEQASK